MNLLREVAAKITTSGPRDLVARELVEALNEAIHKDYEILPFNFVTNGCVWAIEFETSVLVDGEDLVGDDISESVIDLIVRNIELELRAMHVRISQLLYTGKDD